MAQTRVRSYTRNGKRVRTHTRQTRNGRVKITYRTSTWQRPKWAKLSPKRAWRNAKRANRLARHKHALRAALWGSAATSEILAFTAFRGIGTVLTITGLGLGFLGTRMRKA
jgi:hypothetical protein